MLGEEPFQSSLLSEPTVTLDLGITIVRGDVDARVGVVVVDVGRTVVGATVVVGVAVDEDVDPPPGTAVARGASVVEVVAGRRGVEGVVV